MAIERIHKQFNFLKISPVDATWVKMHRALTNLLLLIKTKGQPITPYRREDLTINILSECIKNTPQHFKGFNSEDAMSLMKKWLQTDFVDMIDKSKPGEEKIAGILPLHLDVTKLRNPKYSKDRGAGELLYSIVRESEALREEFEKFFGIATKDDYYNGSDIDIETLFLLRILDNFSLPEGRDRRKRKHEPPLCIGQAELLRNDLLRIFTYSYENRIPRRELINYIEILLGFHISLYLMKVFKMVEKLIETGKFCQKNCKVDPMSEDPFKKCPYKLDILVDLSEAKDLMDDLAKQRVVEHYGFLHRYIKAHLRLKKLDEFNQRLADRELEWQKAESLDEILALQDHPRASVFFESRVDDLLYGRGEESEEIDENLRRIDRLNLKPLDTYIEMLYYLRFKYHRSHHQWLLDSVCGKNKEVGLLQGGRGRKPRKYALGSQLLETLIQLAVVDIDRQSKKFRTKRIRIDEFVQWLKNRYGILIDDYGKETGDSEIQEALRNNYNALKDRLRQLGFFTDLSDASTSQEIRPRFTVPG